VRYVYSVVRFVPDPARGEFINVGAVVGSEEPSEWQVRQIENAKRARSIDEHRTLPVVWSFLDDVGRIIDEHEEAINGFLDPQINPSEMWLKDLYTEHKNVVQLSPPTPMVASSAEEALEQVFEEFVVDAARARKGVQNKHSALAAVRRSYRENQIDKKNLRERATLQTRNHHRERVDFAVTNGRVVQLTHTWSFQVTDQYELAERIKAWGWTIRDAQEYGGTLFSQDEAVLEVDEGVDVEVVYVQPRGKEHSLAWNDAMHVFRALDAHYVPVEKADEVGKKAHELLVTSSL